jgi:hypothetical protein
MTQDNHAMSRAEAKVFVVSAIALSTTVSYIAFWYGVFGTIFFDYLLYVWIAATAALLASLFIPQMETPPLKLPWRGRFILALPTVWLVLSTFIDVEAYRPDSPGTWVLWVATLASAFLTLPYLLYVIIVAVVPDIDRLTHTKLRVALLGILLATGMAGFVIGKNHSLFLTCEDFKVGGHDIPANCRKAGGDPLL